jgi:uncharacterized protein YndB with AHSA1/START domain
MTDITSRVSISIAAPPSRVWEAITTPETIKSWFFGVDTETDWAVGSSIVHRGEYQGRPYEDRGTIVRIEPERLLVHTHWSPASGLSDEPEHYEEITWSIAERNGTTELTIDEVNLASEEAKTASERSWSMALGALKDLLEGRQN